MPNEEFVQRRYYDHGIVKGDPFGLFEAFQLGSTNVAELHKLGLVHSIPKTINFPFKVYKPPQKPSSAKPDTIYIKRVDSTVQICAVGEFKRVARFSSSDDCAKAAEQALYNGASCGTSIAIATDGERYIYIDIDSSLAQKKLSYLEENRSLNPGVLQELLTGKSGALTDPSTLAERVWQAIWHATKEDPKPCLMTFVEIFIFKFLSDTLPKAILPRTLSFYELTDHDEKSFKDRYGKSKIQYYVENVRPHIKTIFPDKTVVTNRALLDLFGLSTMVSDTSIINGFAFLKPGATSLETFDRTFVEILSYFLDFGPLTNINPEFKLRLYEIFLKKTHNKQKLGQFFTPRNIVRAMIRMACLNELEKDSIIFDPAAGVGGFILEPLLDEFGVRNNISFESGKAKQRIRLIGSEVDTNTHILAKANTLIHLAEYIRNPSVTINALNQLMAEIFLNIKTNQHLGTLEYPIKNSVDVILTNPPYVTKGSRIYKEEIANTKGLRNGLSLAEYYDRCGLGLESLFLRYIAGALKPGGYAYVIVPQGMLTRTETALKEKLLSECNLIASISLPENAFFSTAQKTYIIILQKRHTPQDRRPNIFCAIVTSIGESLDARRVPTPSDNKLADIAEQYVAFKKGKPIALKKYIREVPHSEFSASDRWDVKRFWTDEELVELGAREEAIERISFLESAENQITDLARDLTAIKEEIQKLEEGKKETIFLSDKTLFTIRRGKRVTRADGDKHPGDIPVYSGSKDPRRPLCSVTRKWALSAGIPIETKPIVTVNANGYVGATFVRREECIIHDDVMIIEVLDNQIDLDYLRYKLRSAIAEGNYEYEAKLYSRVADLSIEIPVINKGFDVDRQRQIAAAFKKLELLTQSLADLGQWAGSTRFKD